MKIATLAGMRSNRVLTIALLVSLSSTAVLATPVTYESAPVSADTGVAAPSDEPGESGADTSVLFDLSGTPLLWVSTPIYLRLPIFGAGAFDSNGPGLSWVPGGSGSGSADTPPGSDAPPGDVPGNDVPPGDDNPGDDGPPVEAIPEPSTLLLLSPAMMLLMRRRPQSRA